MHYNSNKDRILTLKSSSFSFSLFYKCITKNNNCNRIYLADIPIINKYSRLKLIKNFKEALHLNPEYKIFVYQKNIRNNDNHKKIILKVQHNDKAGTAAKEKELDKGIIKRTKSCFNNGSNDDNDANIDLKYKNANVNKPVNTKKDTQKKEEIGENNEQNYLTHNENTLYQTPILLIDDEPDLLLTFEYILKNQGYKTIKAFSDSKTLLKHLLDIEDIEYYKLVISDIRMPHINGIQLYQILKILNPSIKIIILTSFDTVNEITRIHPEIKSQDIIRKPVDGNHFIKIVSDKVRTI